MTGKCCHFVSAGCTRWKTGCGHCPKQKESLTAVGFIKERKVLAEYYNAADAFVNLTFEDTLPTVNMEAASCGTPVITYDSCGSPELVKEGETGYIIPQLDSKALLNSWYKVREGEIKRSVCRQFGFEMFSKKERYKDYTALFSRFPHRRALQ